MSEELTNESDGQMQAPSSGNSPMAPEVLAPKPVVVIKPPVLVSIVKAAPPILAAAPKVTAAVHVSTSTKKPAKLAELEAALKAK